MNNVHIILVVLIVATLQLVVLLRLQLQVRVERVVPEVRVDLIRMPERTAYVCVLVGVLDIVVLVLVGERDDPAVRGRCDRRFVFVLAQVRLLRVGVGSEEVVLLVILVHIMVVLLVW